MDQLFTAVTNQAEQQMREFSEVKQGMASLHMMVSRLMDRLDGPAQVFPDNSPAPQPLFPVVDANMVNRITRLEQAAACAPMPSGEDETL